MPRPPNMRKSFAHFTRALHVALAGALLSVAGCATLPPPTAELDAAQQDKLERKFATELGVIKRDDRLDTIAQDIVYHFPQRGYLGKGMVITVDKFTAVTMHDKVQQHWKAELKNLRGRINTTTNEVEKARLKKRLEWMKSVEMAVVSAIPKQMKRVSPSKSSTSNHTLPDSTSWMPTVTILNTISKTLNTRCNWYLCALCG